MNALSVELREVSVRRGGRTILQVEKLAVRGGEFVGIIGTNGAGKSTLLKLLCGLIRPSRGQIWLGGERLRARSLKQRIRLCRQMGYIPQAAEYREDLPFTLREVVLMGRMGLKPPPGRMDGEDRKKAERWLGEMGLSNQGGQTFRSLSGGEQQKGLIARAMAGEPKLLLLDEPGANLDFQWKRQLGDILAGIYEQMGMTVLMVSHELNVLPKCCERLVLLERGRIIADGPTEEVLASRAMAEAYGGEVQVVEVAGQRFAVIVGTPSAKH